LKKPTASPIRKVMDEYGRYPAIWVTFEAKAGPDLNSDTIGWMTWEGVITPKKMSSRIMIATAAPIASALLMTTPTRNPSNNGTSRVTRKVAEASGGSMVTIRADGSTP
jgi:hypothetical protein